MRRGGSIGCELVLVAGLVACGGAKTRDASTDGGGTMTSSSSSSSSGSGTGESESTGEPVPVCPLDIEPNASLTLDPGCGTLEARYAWWGTTPEGEEFVVLTATTQEVAAAIQNDGAAAEIGDGMYLRTIPSGGRYSFKYACVGASAEGSVTKQGDTYVGDIQLDVFPIQLDGTFTAVECEYLTVWPVDEGSEN